MIVCPVIGTFVVCHPDVGRTSRRTCNRAGMQRRFWRDRTGEILRKLRMTPEEWLPKNGQYTLHDAVRMTVGGLVSQQNE